MYLREERLRRKKCGRHRNHHIHPMQAIRQGHIWVSYILYYQFQFKEQDDATY